MAKYLFIYHGGSQPESEEAGKEVMGQWIWTSYRSRIRMLPIPGSPCAG
jgi:hypothetical protein